MNMKSKIGNLEKKIFSQSGTPAWALAVAKDWLTRPRYNLEAIDQALKVEYPDYESEPLRPREPHPISDKIDIDGFAADVHMKFKTKEKHEGWQRQRYANGVEKLEAILEKQKSEEPGKKT